MHLVKRNLLISIRRNYKYGLLIIANIILLVFNVWILTNIGASKKLNKPRLSAEIAEQEYYQTLDQYERAVNLQPQPLYAEEKNEPHEKDKTRIDEVYTQAQHKYKVPLRYDYSKRSSYKVPPIEHQKIINCRKVLKDDEGELKKAEQLHLQRPGKIPVPLETYQWWLTRCDDFKTARGYVQVATELEENWPLAFGLSIYRDFEQAERLLRAIWRPHNIYCFHIDVKSSLIFHRTVRALAKCFDNVFIASHLDKIKWGDISVLLPDINCMRDLIRYYRGRWRYFINLTGQEFPIRTNYEIARIAEIFNGSNDIAGSLARMAPDMDRVNHVWGHRWSITYQQMIFYDTMAPKKRFYKNITFYKGEMHGLFSHNFIEYVVESKLSLDYLEWCKNTGHPSEHYYNVLNYNRHLKAPGGYYGNEQLADDYSYNIAIRLKLWNSGRHYKGRPCHGRYVRGICHFGIKDMPWVIKRPEMFINKFNLTYKWYGYECLEEWHRQRTMLMDRVNFDDSYYKSLPTVKFSRKDGLPN